MNANDSRDPVEELAEQFIQQQRRGESPSVEEFARQNPDHAAVIRDLFPTLQIIEHVRDDVVSGPNHGKPTHQKSAGDQVGDYLLVRKLGEGGMGVVFEAIQQSLRRRVAIKILAPRLTRIETYLARFRREAQAAASLQHSNIVPVFGVGSDQDTHYYVMQYIHGRGLDAVLSALRELPHQSGQRDDGRSPALETSAAELASNLARGKINPTRPSKTDSGTRRFRTATTFIARATELPTSKSSSGSFNGTPTSELRCYFERVARLGAEVADGLAFAHDLGILHRDVKPSNLLYDAAGHIWLTDFGLASVDGEDDLTNTGELVGTLRYIAPEATRGVFDARGDIYGLGITLYELLTRQPAFPTSHRADTLRQITDVGPAWITKLEPRIPRDLQTIVHKAIEREPKDRYQSARQLADDLRRFLNHEPIFARRTPWPGIAWRWSKRNPALAASTVAILAGLLFVCCISIVAAYRFAAISDDLVKALAQSDSSAVKAEASERAAKRHLYDANVIAAQLAVHSKGPGQRYQALAAIRLAEPLIDELQLHADERIELRSLAINALGLVDISPVWETSNRQVGHDPRAAAYPEDDLYITTESWPAKHLYLHRISTGKLWTKTPPIDGYIHGFQYEGKDRTLVVAHGLPGQTLDVVGWHISRDGQVETIFTRERRFWQLGFDQARYAGVCGILLDSRTLAIVSLETGQTIQEHRFPSNLYGVRLSANGQKAIAWEFEHHDGCYLVDLRLPSEVIQLPIQAGWDLDLSDAGHLVAVQSDNSVQVWEIPSQQLLTRIDAPSTVDDVDLHPSNEFILTQSWDQQVRIWDRSGELLLTYPGTRPQFSPDGRHVSSMRGDKLGVDQFIAPQSFSARPFDSQHHLFAAMSQHGFWAVFCDGLALYETAFDRPIVRLKSSSELNTQGLILPDQSAIFTTSPQGIVHWPIKRLGERCVIGPPALIDLGFSVDGELVADQTGKVIVAGGLNRFTVLKNQGGSWNVAKSIQHPDTCRSLSLDPDGKFLAVGNQYCTVFNTLTWEPIARFNVSEGGAFDGSGQQLLLANGQSPVVVETNTWQPRPWPFVGFVRNNAISKRHNVGLITDRTDMTMKLIDFGRNRTIASFPVTNSRGVPDRPSYLDEHMRVAISSYNRRGAPARLSIWNLHGLRTELRELQLDWRTPTSDSSSLNHFTPAETFECYAYPPEHETVLVDTATGHTVFEAPYLASAARSVENRPEVRVTVFDRSPLGNRRFSGETCLLWRPMPENQRIDFRVHVARPGTYLLRLSVDASPDRGILRTTINGTRVGKDVDRYSGRGDCVLSLPIDLGQVDLEAGENTIALEVVGKHPLARVGDLCIDYIALVPQEPPIPKSTSATNAPQLPN